MKSPETPVLFVPDLDLGYVRFMKCGSTAIVEALKKARTAVELPKKDYLRLHPYPVVAMWRDPYTRIESAYRYFRMPKRKGFRNLGPDFPSLASFERFVMDVCLRSDRQRDLHFRSQTACEHGLKVAHRVAWNFERLSELFDVTIEPRNEAPAGNINWTEAMVNAFETAFSDDLTMWEAIE